MGMIHIDLYNNGGKLRREVAMIWCCDVGRRKMTMVDGSGPGDGEEDDTWHIFWDLISPP
ncbi:hypothetical protein SESBI_36049 [Sesbania bispinosa]|nr:hypothetical protein SESBI_36049 [Sesbania bispinosa]